MQHPEDSQLVERVLARDREAFEQFYDSYFPRLYRFCAKRIDDTAAIEDIVQETLIKALRHLHRYRGEARLFSWICTICRNEVTDWYRSQGTRTEQTTPLDDNPEILAALESLAFNDCEQQAEQVLVQEAVELALDHLPERYAQALEWKYLDGHSVDVIAERLAVSGLAAQSLLARARLAFRQTFSELSPELPSASGTSKGEPL